MGLETGISRVLLQRGQAMSDLLVLLRIMALDPPKLLVSLKREYQLKLHPCSIAHLPQMGNTQYPP